MLKKLVESATVLSEAFMPAEKAQTSAALGAAEALVIALKAEKLPGFSQANTGPAKEALAQGVLYAVQADECLRRAHREFAKILPDTPLMENGWGCTSPDCGADGRSAELRSLRSAA
jgi:hypothetical protein